MSGIKLLCLVCLCVVLEYSEVSGIPSRWKILPYWKNPRIQLPFEWPLRLPTIVPRKPSTKPPTKAPPQRLHSSGLPYCKEPQDINKILKKGARRTKRTVSWPYECNYASIVKYQGNYQFIWPIHDCCQKCNFPAFTDCVATSRRSSLPAWVCASDGLHCIVECVRTHGPKKEVPKPVLPSIVKPGGGTTAHRLKPGVKPRLRPSPVKPSKFKCAEEKTVNGKKCIRQLCVPLLKI